jgi:hypothetical protein
MSISLLAPYQLTELFSAAVTNVDPEASTQVQVPLPPIPVDLGKYN